MRTAIYAGSFDPVTYGHLDIIERAAEAFDKVLVVIGSNPAKKYLLNLGVRVKLLKSVTAKLPNVQVEAIGDRLLVDFAYEHNIKNIVKGVRNQQDFDYERAMHEINVTQQRGIETHIFISKPTLAHVSSTAAKELAKHHGMVEGYLPMVVKESVEMAYGKMVIGITGSIATGKSTMTQSILSDWALRAPPMVFHVDLDILAHDLLDPKKDNSPMARQLRDDIANAFSLARYEYDAPIDRKKLGEKVFGDAKALDVLNAMFREPLLYKVRQKIQANGHNAPYIILNGALLAEANLLSLCNNNVIITHAHPNVVIERMKRRGLTEEQALRRIKSQYSYEQKLKIIDDRIAKDESGYRITADTSDNKTFGQNHILYWMEKFEGFHNL
jgi:pantetheine-phosphate adenylyltransferase